MSQESVEIPLYKCTKSVRALEIKFINPDTGELLFVDKRFSPLRINKSVIEKEKPKHGDYLVIHDEPGFSFIDHDEFENDYSPISNLV